MQDRLCIWTDTTDTFSLLSREDRRIDATSVWRVEEIWTRPPMNPVLSAPLREHPTCSGLPFG